MQRSKQVSAGLLSLALVIGQSSDALAASPQGRVREITRTSEGQDVARRAAAHIEDKYGIAADPANLAVWAVGDELIAGPRGSSLVMRETVGPNGVKQQYLQATEPQGANSVSGTAVAAADFSTLASGWSLVGSHCWIQADHSYSWIDVCYYKYKATSDGNGAFDYYSLDMYSTFATPGFGLEIGDPWIQANPGAGVAHTWHDWKPREDSDRPCSTSYSIGTSVNGFPLSVGVSQCAMWDITKYATAGKFRNKWTEGFCITRSGETSLEFLIASRVGQGLVPTWTFNWYMNANMASCAT